MAQIIKSKRSNIQGKIPVVGDLELGELALNTYDGKIFMLKDDGTASVQEIGGGAGASELEKITENNNTGWRILGRDPANYGDIGADAIDFSYQNSASTIRGATGGNSFTSGMFTIASGIASTAEGYNCTASGDYSHAEGQVTNATGHKSHAEGSATFAVGDSSHAEGSGTYANGGYSHAQGKDTVVDASYGHAGGDTSSVTSTAINGFAHGYRAKSTFRQATAFGYYARADGRNSFSSGNSTITTGQQSQAFGSYTTSPNDDMMVTGRYNVGTSTDTIHETGIGVDASNKANAFEIYTDGTLTAPESTPALITSRGSKTLATKEYVDANAASDPIEHDFTSTAGQTVFIITGTVLTYCGVFVNGIKRIQSDYAITDNGTDTTVTFGTGLNSGDWVQLLQYN